MTINLTDEQINQIFEGFDWDGYFQDWLTEDIIEDWLNDHKEFLFDYLRYRTSAYIDNYIKENKEELLEIINDF